MQMQSADQNHNSTQAQPAAANAQSSAQPGGTPPDPSQDTAGTANIDSSEQTSSNHWSHKLTVLQFVGLMILPVTLISVVFTMFFEGGAGDALIYAPHLLILSLGPFCWLHGNRTVASAHADETRFNGLKLLTFPPLVGILLFPFFMG